MCSGFEAYNNLMKKVWKRLVLGIVLIISCPIPLAVIGNIESISFRTALFLTAFLFAVGWSVLTHGIVAYRRTKGGTCV